MTIQLEKDLTDLVLLSFSEEKQAAAGMVKDFCLLHFSKELQVLKKKMMCSNTAFYEKEILMVNDEIEVMISGWLPGNTCYPHDHDRARCFVFVLSGKVENTLLHFKYSSLEVISKSTKTVGEDLYLPAGIIHYMQNTGNENLLCLHVYTPGISEMRVFDEPNRKIYTLCGEASAWLPPKEEHILQVRSYDEKKIDQLIS